MKQTYSIFSLVRNALRYHQDWQEAWRSPDPRPDYDVVIIGGGGHGLATAYYLAKEHGITNVAVLEKGWLGGGNTGRNTTVVRSNYLWDEFAHLYEFSLKLWEGLSQDLNYNVMFSQRGLVSLAHSQHEMQALRRRVYAIKLNGIDLEFLTPAQLKEWCPIIHVGRDARYPIVGASLQRRGGVARHDAVAWGFARARRCARRRHHPELRGDRPQGGERPRHRRRDHARRHRRARRSPSPLPAIPAFCAAWPGSGCRSPATCCRRWCRSRSSRCSTPSSPPAWSTSMSASPTRASWCSAPASTATTHIPRPAARRSSKSMLNALTDLFPIFSRLRFLRQWGGIVDTCPDASPIVGKTPVENLFLNCGWGTGGFKATPGSGFVYAHTIATGEPHPLAAPFSLERFSTGYLIDEHGASGVAH